MVIYGLKSCDTCRKAMKALPQARLVDVRVDGVPAAVLAEALQHFGDRLVNRSSTTWRSLEATEHARPAAELLAAHPALMKRPLIETQGRLLLGWGPETRAALGVS